MKKTIRTILNIALSALLIFAFGKFALNTHRSIQSRQEYKEALQIAFNYIPQEPASSGSLPETEAEPEKTPPDDPIVRELLDIDFDALRKENEDVIAWICIPDTKVNYPLLLGSDNEFYLSHTWKKSYNPSGSIFMDCQNNPDFSQFNTIIYGHNMMYDEMFASLHHYRKSEYMQQHPRVYIASADSILCYDVFAAHFADINAIVYGLNIESEQNKDEFLSCVQDFSSVNAEFEPTAEDSFITLSTCTGGDNSKRMVVIGVLSHKLSR